MDVQAAAQALEGLAWAEWLRMSRWGYAAVSALHVFGIALLVGAIVPLDLRLIGFGRALDVRALYRVLARVAVSGLALAAVSGALLFAVRASDYAVMELFAAKMLLIGGGVTHALALHWASDFPAVTRAHQIVAGVISLIVWPTALVCGRLLAFV